MEGKSTDWLRGPSGPTVCRCCFAEGCYKDISTEYFWMGKREVYAEMLTETFDLSIAFALTTGPNSNSRLICEPCISRLRDASEFKRQVQECEKMFMQYLDPARTIVNEIELEIVPEPPEKEVKLERVKQEKGGSDDDFEDRSGFDDMDDDDLDDQPLTKLASKVPKKESVDVSDLLDNAKAEKRKSSTKVKAAPAKKAKKKDAPKASASKAKPEKKKKEIYGNKNLGVVKRNARIILKHSTAYPFKYNNGCLQCCVCLHEFDDPAQFRNHMNTRPHSDIEIFKSARLDKVASVPVDITSLKCKRCPYVYSTVEALVAHLNAKHRVNIDVDQYHGLVPMKLVINKFQCLICSQHYPNLKTLSIHTGKHFNKFICDVCGRKYKTASSLQSHIQAGHLKKEICLRCKKIFPSAEARRQHIKNTKACHPARCKTCGERFMSWDLKEDHMIGAHNKEKKSWTCSVCGLTFANRFYLNCHFKTAHTNEHKCHYCNTQFPSITKLKVHIAKHTGEREYICHVCDMAFVDKGSWNRHLIIHDDSKKIPCPVCNMLFLRKYRVNEHLKKCHPDADYKKIT